MTGGALLSRRTALAMFAVAPLAPAMGARDQRPLILTGSAVRRPRVAFVPIELYSISHYMRAVPGGRDPGAIIRMETDKMFVCRTLVALSAGELKMDLRRGFRRNRYRNDGNIEALLRAIDGPLASGTQFQIAYSERDHTTRMVVERGKRSAVRGSEMMRAAWSIWLGTTDQPGLREALAGTPRHPNALLAPPADNVLLTRVTDAVSLD
jgi:hypothetical protein